MEIQSNNGAPILTRISLWLATGLGVGMVTPAPGTVGGLWGIPLSWALLQLENPNLRLSALALILLLSAVLCDIAARQLACKDPGEIVLDEIAVLPIVFLATGLANWKLLLVGWLLFRFFDILKPYPVRQLERLPGGWGIMADDCLAACYAAIVLRGLVWLDSNRGWEWFSA